MRILRTSYILCILIIPLLLYFSIPPEVPPQQLFSQPLFPSQLPPFLLLYSSPSSVTHRVQSMLPMNTREEDNPLNSQHTMDHISEEKWAFLSWQCLHLQLEGGGHLWPSLILARMLKRKDWQSMKLTYFSTLTLWSVKCPTLHTHWLEVNSLHLVPPPISYSLGIEFIFSPGTQTPNPPVSGSWL